MNMLDEGQKLLKYLKKQNIEAYIVGGAVRDYLLKRQVKDLDIACKTDIDKLFSVVKNFIVDDSAKKYGSLKIKEHPGDKFTELTCFREDLEYKDNRHPIIKYTTDIYIDALRRDFTINCLYMDEENRIYDPLGVKDDIDKKIIKTCIPSDKSFKSDSLRMLRAIRFSLRLGFKLDDEVIQALKKNQHLLINSKGKIKAELDEILQYNNYYYLLIFDYFKPFAKEFKMLAKEMSLSEKYLVLNLYKKMDLNYSRKENKFIKKYLFISKISNYDIYTHYDEKAYLGHLYKLVYNKELDFNISIRSRKDININIKQIKEYTKEVNEAYVKLEKAILSNSIANDTLAIQKFLGDCYENK